MKRLTRACSAIVAALTLVAMTSTAFAQSPVPEVGKDDDDKTTTAAVTEYDYENDQISGDLSKPLMSRVGATLQDKLPGLKIVRTTFVDELIESTDTL